VAVLVQVFREVGRILRPDGTLFLVLADTYDDRGNLLGVPLSVALALKQDGWVWRDTIIRVKAEMVDNELQGSCMPESQENRCTRSYEFVLLLTRDPSAYFFDSDAVRSDSGAMLRSVWRINTEPSPLPHFAMMPTLLAE